MKSHVPTNTKLHIACKTVHKICTSNYSGQVGHEQVPVIHKNKQQGQKVLRGRTVKEGNSLLLLPWLLPPTMVSHPPHRCLWLRHHTYNQLLFHNTFPHLSAACALPSYPAFAPQILLYHLFLPI